MINNTIYIGIVKKNDDPQKMGRISVWIPELAGDPKDPRSWYTVSYASPFAGTTSPNNLKRDSTSMDGSQLSYGFWMMPPDLDNQVLVCFANGKLSQGFWFACIYPQNMNHMVPGIPINVPTDKASTQDGLPPPVVEYNKWSDLNPTDPPRPIFTPLHEGLKSQGLYPDQERGPGSSGARREAPSKVFGYLTPRGNSIHVDDNSANEFIRMRTRGGTQVLIHETSGYVYINSKQGNSWIEISDEGIDVYSKKDVSIRAEGNLNLKADQSIYLDAGLNLHIRAAKAVSASAGTNIDLKAATSIHLDAATDVSSKAGGSILQDAANNVSMKSGGDNLTQAGGNVRESAGGSITEKAGGSNVRQASSNSDLPPVPTGGGGGSAPSVSAASAPAATVPAPAELANITGSSGNWQRGSLKTIVPRMPTHEPWPSHTKEGLTSTNSDPANPTASETQAIAARGGTPTGNGNPASFTLAKPYNVELVTGSGQIVAIPKVSAVLDTSPKGLVGKFQVSQSVIAGVKEAASITGIKPGFLMAQAEMMSGFVSDAKSTLTSAKGLFQISDANWGSMVQKYGAKYGVGFTDQTDPRASSIIAGLMNQENKSFLTKVGITVGNPELYMSNVFGVAPTAQFMRAFTNDPTTPVTQVFTTAMISANKGSLAYRDGTPKTVGDVYGSISAQVNAKTNMYDLLIPAADTAPTDVVVTPPDPGSGATGGGGTGGTTGGTTTVDQVTTFSKALTLSKTWQDSGIHGANLATGTYVVRVLVNDVGVGGQEVNEYYSGIMSWYDGDTDSTVTDELLLHRAGAGPGAGAVYLRVCRTVTGNASDLKLQIAGDTTNNAASTYVFTFRRMI